MFFHFAAFFLDFLIYNKCLIKVFTASEEKTWGRNLKWSSGLLFMMTENEDPAKRRIGVRLFSHVDHGGLTIMNLRGILGRYKAGIITVEAENRSITRTVLPREEQRETWAVPRLHLH